MRGSNANAGKMPGQVAKELQQRFCSKGVDSLRAKFWMEVAKDPKLSRQFETIHPKNLALMRAGKAPHADPTQCLGKQTKYILHHSTPIRSNGAPLDLSNIVIATPRYHKEILNPKVHYGR